MNELVVKDNVLINASYNLSLVEQRLILLAIIVTREHQHNMQWDFKLGKPIEVTAKQYIDAFGVTRQTAYEALQDACKTLFNRQFSYQEKSVKGIWHKTSRWVSDIAYINETATVSFTFAPAVLPLITELEQHLTSYELQQVASLSSAYSVRLYEVLIAWRSSGKTPRIPIEQLRHRLGVLDNEYTRMSNFKSRVLDYSIEQINEHTDITAKYEQHKQGRKVTAFSFTFKVKKDKKKEVANDKRDPDTPDMFTGKTDKEVQGYKTSWRKNGLTDAQINKLKIYKTEFCDANIAKMPTSWTKGYDELIESWRLALKDPKRATHFNMVQELLDRSK